MSEEHYEWARAEERGLARFVQVDLPDVLQLPSYINSLDLLMDKGPAGLAEQLYDVLRRQAIHYDLAPFDPRITTIQRVRKAKTILAERRGTCLDLALLFAGISLKYDLLPLLIVLDGHALVGVSRTRTRRDTRRPPKAFAFDRGLLANLATLQDLAQEEYLLMECTGFAQTTVALSDNFPEGRGRNANGYMSFDRSCDAGLEQLTRHTRTPSDSSVQHTRAFLYALDIHDLQVNQQIEPLPLGEDEQWAASAPGSDDIKVGDLSDVQGVAIGPRTRTRVYHNVPEQQRQPAPMAPAPRGRSRIHVGNITGAQGVAIGADSSAEVVEHTVGRPTAARQYAAIYEQIQADMNIPTPIKQFAADTVKTIEQEVSKGEQADAQKITESLDVLARLTPDILDMVRHVVAATSGGHPAS